MLAPINGYADKNMEDIENYIGLYEIVSSECKIAKRKIATCDHNHFFELLKGKFIGIKPSELGYVIWSGDPTIDSEFQYTSHLIPKHKSKSISENKYWITKDSDTQEYLTFSDGKLLSYDAIYNASSNRNRRTINYKLRSTKRDIFPSARLNYPVIE
jgi:hypothetical protein